MTEEEKILFKLVESAVRELVLETRREENYHEEYWAHLAILIEAHPTLFPKRLVQISEKPGSTMNERAQNAFAARAILEAHKSLPEVYRSKPSQVHENLIPMFEISREDAQRISELCTQMRKIVHNSNNFDQPHKVRLLDRIAAIEQESLKPKGTFDVVRGGINDLGETLGKFGTDVEPLTKRMKEVVSIARRGTKEYEKLPEPEETKALPKPSDDFDGDEP